MIENQYNEVMTFPVNGTEKLIYKYCIHAHPYKKGYPSKVTPYVAFRLSDGIVEKIFEVKHVYECFSYDIETLKNQLTHEELLRLQGYVEERQMSFGFDKAEYQYRFFFLEEYKTLASPYVFEKNVQGAKSIMLDEMLKNYSERERILFCNIAYMKYYDFSRHKETPINGGQYITDTGDAFEKYNFHRCEDGTVKGFVETKYVGGYDASSRRPQGLHIEKIDSAYQSQDEIEKVTVVFCAKNPKKNINTTVIVGWYKNAKVFRNRKEYLGRPYNIESNYHDAVLLPEQKRNKVIPRAKDNMNNVGFGQSNIWYANKVEHQSLVLDVLKYIDQYSKNKLAKDLRRYNAREDIVLNDFINTHHAKKNYQFEYNNDPEMRREPKVLNQGVSVYPRDKQKSINAIVHSQYKCEINPQHETFNKKSDGLPYLEAHHLIPMSQQDEFEYSLDVEENIVALCSNCHNEIHYGEQANVLIKQLYHNRIELLKKKKIDVSLEKLLSYYGY